MPLSHDYAGAASPDSQSCLKSVQNVPVCGTPLINHSEIIKRCAAISDILARAVNAAL